MRLRQVIEALEKAERDNPDLKDHDVRVSNHDAKDSGLIVHNIRVTGIGVEIVYTQRPHGAV